MASLYENVSMAVFCDFENVALGVRDAKYEKFDIKPVLERLLLKGSIVVKKAYCDWDRYKDFKAAMHEAQFRADRNSARAPVGQELGGYPPGRRCARPLLHQDRTSIRSSSSAATRIFRRWCPSCAKTPSR